MPPQRRIRKITLEELFAERIDLTRQIDSKVRKVVLKMTCEFLMLNAYIDFIRYRSANRYPYLFAFIFGCATVEKSRHNNQISHWVHFLDKKRYDRDVKHAFKLIYGEYPENYSFVLISAFAMNICRHIRKNRIILQMWYMRDAVLLLSRMFCGNRFQMKSSFDDLEELASLHYGSSIITILTIIAQSEVSQTVFVDDYSFIDSILNAYTVRPSAICRP